MRRKIGIFLAYLPRPSEDIAMSSMLPYVLLIMLPLMGSILSSLYTVMIGSHCKLDVIDFILKHFLYLLPTPLL